VKNQKIFFGIYSGKYSEAGSIRPAKSKLNQGDNLIEIISRSPDPPHLALAELIDQKKADYLSQAIGLSTKFQVTI
jgi:hypothetical protein